MSQIHHLLLLAILDDDDGRGRFFAGTIKIPIELCASHNWNDLAFQRRKLSLVSFSEIVCPRLDDDEEELDMA
jgi:hypothetical protein